MDDGSARECDDEYHQQTSRRRRRRTITTALHRDHVFLMRQVRVILSLLLVLLVPSNLTTVVATKTAAFVVTRSISTRITTTTTTTTTTTRVTLAAMGGDRRPSQPYRRSRRRGLLNREEYYSVHDMHERHQAFVDQNSRRIPPAVLDSTYLDSNDPNLYQKVQSYDFLHNDGEHGATQQQSEEMMYDYMMEDPVEEELEEARRQANLRNNPKNQNSSKIMETQNSMRRRVPPPVLDSTYLDNGDPNLWEKVQSYQPPDLMVEKQSETVLNRSSTSNRRRNNNINKPPFDRNEHDHNVVNLQDHPPEMPQKEEEEDDDSNVGILQDHPPEMSQEEEEEEIAEQRTTFLSEELSSPPFNDSPILGGNNQKGKFDDHDEEEEENDQKGKFDDHDDEEENDQGVGGPVSFSSSSSPYQKQETLDELESQLDDLTKQIYQQNNDKEFNINSPKQVATVLFGTTEGGFSTDKDTLESRASTGDRMSSLILQYRKIKALYRKRHKQQELTEQGRRVQSVMTKQQKVVTQTTSTTTKTSDDTLVDDDVVDGSDFNAHEDLTSTETAAHDAANAATHPETTTITTQKEEEEEEEEEQVVVMEEVAADPLLLVDASALIFRSYHGMPALHRQDGMPTGALMGFCNTLNRLLIPHLPLQSLQDDNDDDDVEAPDEDATSTTTTPEVEEATAHAHAMPRIILIFDSKKRQTFRHQMYPDYKSNRKEVPIDLIPQFDLVRQAASIYGICQIEAPGYEADDVIATLATWASRYGTTTHEDKDSKKKKTSIDTYILSADKDLMQLITTQDEDEDENGPGSVHMIDPMSMARTTHKEVLEKWQVNPSELGDLLALAGDSADNVPGVQGIGPKTGATLLQQFGSLDSLLDNLDQVKQKGRREKLQAHVKEVRLSRKLVALECNIPFDQLVVTMPPSSSSSSSAYRNITDSSLSFKSFDFGRWVDSVRMQPINSSRVLRFYDEMNFQQLKFRFRSLMERREELEQVEEEIQRRRRQQQQRRRRPKATVPKPEDYKNVPF